MCPSFVFVQILLQAILSSIVHWMPGLGMNGFPRFNSMGLLQLLVWHCGPAEFVYYWLHRLLHEPALFKRFHSHHHRSITTEPITGALFPPFLEISVALICLVCRERPPVRGAFVVCSQLCHPNGWHVDGRGSEHSDVLHLHARF